jgi:Bacteriophage replication gene A protein (GPA).
MTSIFGEFGRGLKFLKEALDLTFFDSRANLKESNCLLITLTFDVKISEQKEAWESIGSYLNSYITNLRKKFGRISYVRVWEAFFNGYPHVHILAYFHSYNFRVFRHNGKWRIREKGEFEKGYHSFVDVQAVRSLRGGISYVTKYLTKGYRPGSMAIDGSVSERGFRKNLSDLTLALCWIFRKHSFAISRDFNDLINDLRNSNCSGASQLDLMGGVVENRVSWVYIGVFSKARLGIEDDSWFVNLDSSVLSELC